MKVKGLLLVSALALMSVTSFAATAIETGTKFGTGEDSIRCMENVSLFSSYYKIKQYDEAYNAFKVLFEECPQSYGKNLYIHGVTVIKYKMNQEKDPAKRQEWFAMLMKCYENRVLYFGNDAKQPESYIRGRQAIDYIELSGEKDNAKLEAVALPWLKMSVEGRGSASEAAVVDYYFRMLTAQYKSDVEKYRESYIDTYLKIDKLLEGSIALATDKNRDSYKTTRNNVSSSFINSGAADCNTLDGVFAKKVEESKDNVIDLTTIIKLYKGAKCTESDVYFAASTYAHKLNPSSETAAGCGYQALKKKEWQQAYDFFTEAMGLIDAPAADAAEADSVKYEYQYIITGILMTQGKYAEAKASALKAIQFNPNEGEPYILLAQMYTNSKYNPLGDDKILAKTVYWLAVDKLERAKAIDPDCAEKAQALINQYRKYYPSKEDVFFKPELKVGETFHIGGWINESVRCRD